MSSAVRLEGLAETISTRDEPLGSDFSSGCWGAVAKDIAHEQGMDPCDYFGFSDELYKAAIRANAALPVEQRNHVMVAFTRALADTASSTEHAGPAAVGA